MKIISLVLGIFFNTNAYCIDKYDYELLKANCLYESANTNMAEKIAIVHVVLNRVKSKRWPNTIKGVILQNKQFSWTNNIGSLREPTIKERNQCNTAILKAFKTKQHVFNHYYLASIDPPNWAQGSQSVLVDKHLFLEL